MYTHTSLTVLSTIMPECEDASKNNLALVILQSTKIIKFLTSGMLGVSFHCVDQNENVAR